MGGLGVVSSINPTLPNLEQTNSILQGPTAVLTLVGVGLDCGIGAMNNKQLSRLALRELLAPCVHPHKPTLSRRLLGQENLYF